MGQSLNLIGWLACIVYSTIPLFWLAIHPRATYWRSRRRSPYRVLLPLWIALWIVAGLVTATWRQVVLYSSLWAWVHSRVRHPVYLAHFCEMVAWSLGTG